MRRTALFALAAILAVPALPAKAESGIDVGTIVGAGLGGLIGNQIGKGTGKTVATVAGVILGGVVGHGVDQNWDNGYRRTSYSAPTRYYQPQPVYYQGYRHYEPRQPGVIYQRTVVIDDDRGYHRGRGHGHYKHHRKHGNRHVQDIQRPVLYEGYGGAYQDIGYQRPSSNRYCREYTDRVQVGGRWQESYGTACLQPDGSWQVVN